MVRVRGGGTHRQKLPTHQRKQDTTTQLEHETPPIRAPVQSSAPQRSSELDGDIYVEHELEEDRDVDREREPDNGENCDVDGEDDCDVVNDEDADDGLEAVRDEEVGSDVDSGDDIWDDERIPDPLSSSDDDEEETEHELRENEDTEELLTLGKTYNSTDDFKLAVLKYSLKTRYDVELYRSQAMKVGAKCSDTDVECPWRIYCSYKKRRHKMQIKVYVNNHICVRSGRSNMLKRSTIAWLFSERLRINPKLTQHEMVHEIKREYNLEVTDDQCGKAKSKVLRERKASHEKHFSRIWDYQAEIYLQNEGSTFEIETVPRTTIGSKQRFYRLYICFRAQRESWKQTCRPIIGLDGAFLKWDIKGHLLAAVGRDGDNRIVPIAWAVVEIENDTNWDWFVRLLFVDLDLGDGQNVAVLLDKHRLVKAVHTILPQAEHRQCAKHIMDNWKRDSHDQELQRLFWKIARSYTIGEYTDNSEALKRFNLHAYNSLQNTNPESWSRAFFRIATCCNDNLNNLSESFNRTIREARRKPLLDLLEDIRRQCMVRNAKRSIIAGRLKTRFTKRAHCEIEKAINGSQHCIRYMARNNLYEVEHNSVNYVVDMNEKTCSCRKWQMVGIPCAHAASVIIGKKEKVEAYVNEYYTTQKWRETYKDGIKPVQGMMLWPRLNRLAVLPPPWRRGNPGRPSNYARRKGRNEFGSSKTMLTRRKRVMTCSNCKEDGHNKQGCKNPSVESQPKRPRGRPKNQGELLQSHAQGSQAQGQSVSVGLGSQG
ncbi:hypothetical protein BRARA_B02045 [Brassica rapa]|uniref:SWIM-type domain-containing protein n=1 Tax=Brassica campestris TaxID=3711 RepID=A0A398AAU3_BRACM|nr:hypothetical protein BRARA_B02045 [Brassica rapa]